MLGIVSVLFQRNIILYVFIIQMLKRGQISYFNGGISMSSISEQYMEVKSEALIMGFLKTLNQENFINNKTYLEAVEKLKKGDVKKNVN